MKNDCASEINRMADGGPVLFRSRPGISGWGILGLLAILIPMVILFGFMGNTHDPGTYGPSIISWLIKQWLDPGSDSGHGWLVPTFSIWLIWKKRHEFKMTETYIDWRGLLVVFISLLLYWAGFRSQQPRLGLLALIGVLWGTPFFLWGKKTAGLTFFPCVFLLFGIPMGFLSAFTFTFRLFSCVVSAALLNGLGISCVRIGTAILSTGIDGFQFDVADPCSGLRSVIALCALTAGYAYISQKTVWKKWLLFLLAIPLAITGNVVRIITIGIVAETINKDAAMTIYHDYSGYIIFASAVVLMMSIGTILQKDLRSSVREWAISRQKHH